MKNKKDIVYLWYSIANKMYKKNLEILSIIIRVMMRIIFSCDISYKCQIGEGTRFPHMALGVTIHQDAKIGSKCIINQNVTIGGRSGSDILPNIGAGTIIGAGAQVLGNVEIGKNVQIGAGAVVIKSVEEGKKVVGIPAREI